MTCLIVVGTIGRSNHVNKTPSAQSSLCIFLAESEEPCEQLPSGHLTTQGLRCSPVRAAGANSRKHPRNRAHGGTALPCLALPSRPRKDTLCSVCLVFLSDFPSPPLCLRSPRRSRAFLGPISAFLGIDHRNAMGRALSLGPRPGLLQAGCRLGGAGCASHRNGQAEDACLLAWPATLCSCLCTCVWQLPRHRAGGSGSGLGRGVGGGGSDLGGGAFGSTKILRDLIKVWFL